MLTHLYGQSNNIRQLDIVNFLVVHTNPSSLNNGGLNNTIV